MHIESRRSRRANSEYEIYVDLEADRQLVHESMKQLKRQVSCVRFDLNNLAELTDTVDQRFDDGVNGYEDIELPPPSPFLDQNGQPIQRKSKSSSSQTTAHTPDLIIPTDESERHQMWEIASANAFYYSEIKVQKLLRVSNVAQFDAGTFSVRYLFSNGAIGCGSLASSRR